MMRKRVTSQVTMVFRWGEKRILLRWNMRSPEITNITDIALRTYELIQSNTQLYFPWCFNKTFMAFIVYGIVGLALLYN